MKIIIQGFRSYLCNEEFDFPDSSISLITGLSGSGKSSIFQAIYWCLYGTLRNIHSNGNEKSCCVILILDKIKIIRKTHPSQLCYVLTNDNKDEKKLSSSINNEEGSNKNEKKLSSFNNNEDEKRLSSFNNNEEGSNKDEKKLSSFNNEEKKYYNQEAQEMINQTFGDKDIWHATSYIEQQERCQFLTLSNDKKMDLLNKLSFSQDHPDDLIDKIENEIKKKKEGFQQNKIEYDLLVQQFQKDTTQRPWNKDFIIEDINQLQLKLQEYQDRSLTLKNELLVQRELKGRITCFENQLKKCQEENKRLRKVESQDIEKIEREIEHQHRLKDQFQQAQEEQKKKTVWQEWKSYYDQFNTIKNDIIQPQKKEELINFLLNKQGSNNIPDEELSLMINSYIKNINEKDLSLLFDQNERFQYYSNLAQICRVGYHVEEIKKKIEYNYDKIEKLHRIQYQHHQIILLTRFENDIDKIKKDITNIDPSYIDFLSTIDKQQITLTIQNLREKYQQLYFNYQQYQNTWNCPYCQKPFKIKDNKTLPLEIKDNCDVRDLEKKLTDTNYIISLFEKLSKLIDEKTTIQHNLESQDVENNSFEHNLKSQDLKNNSFEHNLKLQDLKNNNFEHTLKLQDLKNNNFEHALKQQDVENNNFEHNLKSQDLENNRNLDKEIDQYNQENQQLSQIIIINPPLISKNLLQSLINLKHVYQQLDHYEYFHFSPTWNDNDKISNVPNINLRDIENAMISLTQEKNQLIHQQILYGENIKKMNDFQKELDHLRSNNIINNDLEKLWEDNNRLIEENRKKIEDARYFQNIQERYNLIMKKYHFLMQEDKDISNLQKLYQNAINAQCQALQEIVDHLNNYVNIIITAMFDQPITLTLQLYRQTKTRCKPQVNFSILYKGIEYDNINNLSGGEGDRISLALILALHQMNNTPFLLLDECFSSLDETYRSSCLTAIRSFFPQRKTIIFINHEDTSNYDYVMKLR